jgi:uncharacterized membrane protein
MAASTNRIWSAIGSVIAILLIGLYLMVLFGVSIFYIGKQSDMPKLIAAENIVFRSAIMCLLSLLIQILIRGLSKLMPQNRFLIELSKKQVLWVLLIISIVWVTLIWGTNLL